MLPGSRPNLETAITGTEFEVIGHGLSGKVAQGAADRMKREVEDAKPELVIWQVGTNDALRHVAIDGFKTSLKRTLAWPKEQNVDVILINPQYSEALAQDPCYKDVVAAINAVALSFQRRHGAHFDLASDNLHMNAGYRHLAQHVAATRAGPGEGRPKGLHGEKVSTSRSGPRLATMVLPPLQILLPAI